MPQVHVIPVVLSHRHSPDADITPENRLRRLLPMENGGSRALAIFVHTCCRLPKRTSRSQTSKSSNSGVFRKHQTRAFAFHCSDGTAVSAVAATSASFNNALTRQIRMFGSRGSLQPPTNRFRDVSRPRATRNTLTGSNEAASQTIRATARKRSVVAKKT